MRPEDFDKGYLLLELSPAGDALWHAAYQEFAAGAEVGHGGRREPGAAGAAGGAGSSEDAGDGVWYPRWFWPSFAVPGTLVLVLLFLVPFYVDPLGGVRAAGPDLRERRSPSGTRCTGTPRRSVFVLNQTFLIGGIYRPAMIRTLLYVAIATGDLRLLIGYPVAYYIARYGGRYKALLLVALIAPFWIAYLMRMLAWVNLLQDDGLVNQALQGLGLIDQPDRSGWTGQPITVILGLVYGYIPYMILPLFGGARPDRRLAARGGPRPGSQPVRRTFLRVTLPLSKQAILAGTIIVILPMFGDYYTHDLLSASPRTSMVGNLIDEAHQQPLRGAGGLAGGRADAAAAAPDALLPATPRAVQSRRPDERGRHRARGGRVQAERAGAPPLRRPVPRRGSPNPWGKPRSWSSFTAAVPAVVAGAGGARRAVLVQHRPVAERRGRASRSAGTAATRSSVVHDPTLRGALTQSLKLSLLTMLIAVPLGVAFAIGVDRWRGRRIGHRANFG